jgi:hypothetical protein
MEKPQKFANLPFETVLSFRNDILAFNSDLRSTTPYIHGRSRETKIVDFWYFFRYLSVVVISRLSRL